MLVSWHKWSDLFGDSERTLNNRIVCQRADKQHRYILFGILIECLVSEMWTEIEKIVLMQFVNTYSNTNISIK